MKIIQTLQGVKNVPMDVFLENSYVSPEEAEQIIYRLIVQKRINAAITMNNGRTFITTVGLEETVATITEKPKTTPKKTTATKKSPAKKPAATPKKTTTNKKKPSTTKKTTKSSGY